MVGVSLAQVSTCPSVLSSTFITNSHNTPNFLPCLPLRSKKKLFVVKSTSSPNSEISQLPSSSEENKNLLSVVLNVSQTLWKKTIRPLMDFGFGKRSIWEGGVGLFIISGTVLLALSIAWLRGFQLRSRFKRYSAVFEFAQASGICTGTPVRIRGVTVGNVVKVNPSLRSIEAVAEIEDDKIIIPRNSLVEVNQSGLLMETMIDITPRNPIPTPSRGPLDQDCVKESLILCDKQKMKGNQGVSLDELVGIFTRIGREVEEIGVSNTYALAQRVASVIEEAKPLLIKVQEIAEDVQPLLAEVHNGGLLNEVQSLTKSLTEASEDLRRVQSSILTPENTELIRKSIYSLIFTLKNIENISSDILGFTGDEATRRNLKLLIKSLSRLI